MPKGVEHTGIEVGRRGGVEVKKAVMPKGVEHDCALPGVAVKVV